jgi:hypothetical protein
MEYLITLVHSSVTQEGVIIKLIAFIWAYTFNNLHKIQIAT